MFAISWMGTMGYFDCISVTAIFNVFFDYLLNEKSKLCIVPKKYREYENILDLDGDGEVTEDEINKATEILKKAKEKARKKDILRNISTFEI